MSNIRFTLVPPTSSPQKILYWCAWYFFVCGVTAILWPASWYFAAGIPPLQNDIALSVTGAMMIGLSVGGFLSSPLSAKDLTVSLMMCTANLMDLLVVGHGAFVGSLPLLNSVIFIAVDASWCVALLIAYNQMKRSL